MRAPDVALSACAKPVPVESRRAPLLLDVASLPCDCMTECSGLSCLAGRLSLNLLFPTLPSVLSAGACLVLLKVVGQDVVLAQADAARNGLLPAHDQPQQRALPAAVGTCSAA